MIFGDNRSKNSKETAAKTLQDIIADPLVMPRARLHEFALERSFTETDLSKTLQLLPSFTEHKREISQIKETFKTGRAEKAPDLSTPEKQFIWAACLLHASLDPKLSKIYGTKAFRSTALWQQLTRSQKATAELQSLSRALSLSINDNLTTIGWGIPGSGLWFAPDKNHVNLDLFQTLHMGFDHVRAEALCEANRSQISVEYTPAMRKIVEKIQKLSADTLEKPLQADDYAKIRVLQAEKHMREEFFNALEDVCVNRYTGVMSKNLPQDLGYSLNYNAFVRQDVIAPELQAEPAPQTRPPQTKNDQPLSLAEAENRFRNLCRLGKASYYRRNSGINDDAAGWQAVRADPTLLDGPTGNWEKDAAHFFEKIHGKDGVENLYPTINNYFFLSFLFNNRAKANSKARGLLIDRLWNEYATKYADTILHNIHARSLNVSEPERESFRQKIAEQSKNKEEAQEKQDTLPSGAWQNLHDEQANKESAQNVVQDSESGKEKREDNAISAEKGKEKEGEQEKDPFASSKPNDEWPEYEPPTPAPKSQSAPILEPSPTSILADNAIAKEATVHAEIRLETENKEDAAAKLPSEADENPPAEPRPETKPAEKKLPPTKSYAEILSQHNFIDFDSPEQVRSVARLRYSAALDKEDGSSYRLADLALAAQQLEFMTVNASNQEDIASALSNAVQSGGMMGDPQNGGHKRGVVFTDYINLDWSDTRARRAELLPFTNSVARKLGYIRSRQLQRVTKPSSLREIFPDSGDIRGRLDIKAHMDYRIKQATRQPITVKDMERFRKNDVFYEPTTIELVIMTDGSGSMRNGLPGGGTIMRSAMQSSMILRESGMKAGYDTFLAIWGDDKIRMLAEPGDKDCDVGPRIEAHKDGINSGTDISPSLRQILKVLAHHRNTYGTSFSGMTHFIILSDGDLNDGDMKTALNIMEAILKSGNITIDIAIFKNGTTNMDNVADILIAKKLNIGKIHCSNAREIPKILVDCLAKRIARNNTRAVRPDRAKRQELLALHRQCLTL